MEQINDASSQSPAVSYRPASTHAGAILLSRAFRVLTKEISLGFSLAVSTLFAVGVIAGIYPLEFLLGHGAYFQTSDAAQHLTGWFAFAQDSWRFPLLKSERLNFPLGANIAFTDSIPLAAILFKPFAAILPERFHYFGWWHGFAFLSQALAATSLIRALGARHLVAVAAAVIFALASPSLLWRLWHSALMTHGLILFALALYFYGRKPNANTTAVAAGLMTLSIAGLLIHPYFFAFTYPILLAYLADQAIAAEGWRRQIPRLLASVAVVAAVGLAFGYLGRGGTITDGFAYYSLNLKSPFCGGHFSPLAPCGYEGSGGQHEGFNYLGAGLLLLIPCVLFLERSTLHRLPRTYPALCAVLVLFTLYALSNVVYWGPEKILEYRLPTVLQFFTGTFRGSGRFFWTVGYVILFATLARLLARPSWSSIVLVMAAASVQWMDTRAMRDNISLEAGRPYQTDMDAWSTLVSGTDLIHFYPAYTCGQSRPDHYLLMQRVASEYKKRMSTGCLARMRADCELDRQTFDRTFEAGGLYVVPLSELDDRPFDLPAGFQGAVKRGDCASLADLLVCKSGAAQTGWATIAPEAMPVRRIGSETAMWQGSQLLGMTGKVDRFSRVAGPADREGFLTFGPYVRLPQGRYEFVLEYSGSGEQAEPLGWWDVVRHEEGKLSVMMSGGLIATKGNIAKLSQQFEVKQGRNPVEIRAYFAGKGTLRVSALRLRPVKP